MSAMASRITRLMIVCSNDYAGADQRKHQSSASLAFMRGIRRWPVNSPHKVPVTRNTFPFDDGIMNLKNLRPCIWGKCVPPPLMKSSGWLETYIYLAPCLILWDYLRLLFLIVETDEYCWKKIFSFQKHNFDKGFNWWYRSFLSEDVFTKAALVLDQHQLGELIVTDMEPIFINLTISLRI